MMSKNFAVQSPVMRCVGCPGPGRAHAGQAVFPAGTALLADPACLEHLVEEGRLAEAEIPTACLPSGGFSWPMMLESSF